MRVAFILKYWLWLFKLYEYENIFASFFFEFIIFALISLPQSNNVNLDISIAKKLSNMRTSSF